MSQAPETPAHTLRQTCDYVTVTISGQLFGIPISQVQDVFQPLRVTRVPLAHPNIAGVLNLRGRIVTAIECRTRLGLPPREAKAKPMAVGIEHGAESFGLIIDAVGEVLTLETRLLEPNPANLDAKWRSVSKGVYRLEARLLIVLDVSALLQLEPLAA